MSALRKLLSGGQTGVDRAALDAARGAGLETGGWCPAGRWAEDGPIPGEYPLDETPEREPAQRTAWNVRDADATLLLVRGAPRGGTALTLACARQAGRPHRVVDLAEEPDVPALAAWIDAEGVEILNVAGPRESEAPGIGAAAGALVSRLLALLEPTGPATGRGPAGKPGPPAG